MEKLDFTEQVAKNQLTGSPFPSMAKIVKPGICGEAEVSTFKLTSDAIMMQNLRSARDGNIERLLCPGEFARLKIKGEVVMSDTPMEHVTNRALIHNAKGRVLIAGLGLGMVVHALVKNPKVESIDVVEINKDVITLISPTLPNPTPRKPRIQIILSCIEAYGMVIKLRKMENRPKWDTIYFDIWPTIDADDADQVNRLKRMFRQRLSEGGWIGAWADDLRRKQMRQD